MPAYVHHRYSTAAETRMFLNPSGRVARNLYIRARRVEAGARRLIQVDTGRARSTIHTELTHRGLAVAWRVGTRDRVAGYLHEGTGVYGPRGQRVEARAGRLLAWRARGSSRWTFARSVSGVRPSKFMTRALPLARG